MKLHIMLFLLCLLLPIFSYSVDNRIFTNYSHESYTTDYSYSIDRINFGNGVVLYKGILAEPTKFNLTRISHDSWNDYKDNYSVASLAPGLIDFFLNTTFPDSSSENIKRLVLSLSTYMTNSMLYYPLLKSVSPTMSNLNIAPFIKNDTDVFMFRQSIWGQFTPGVGVRVYYGNSQSEFGVAIGIERTLQTDFTSKTRTHDLYFARAGMSLFYRK